MRLSGSDLAAWAPSYGLVVALVFVAGIGVAAYHPEGAKLATYVSGRKRASGMWLFDVGGNRATPSARLWSLRSSSGSGMGWGGLVASIPVLAVAGVLLLNLPYLAGRQPAHTGSTRTAEATDDVRAMLVLTAVIGFRSVAWFGLLTFVPLWIVSLGDSKAQGNHLLVADARSPAASARLCSVRWPTDSDCAGRCFVTQVLSHSC